MSGAKGCGPSDVRRVLLGNVLCNQRAPGFAAHLWQLAELDLTVIVRDALPRYAGHEESLLMMQPLGPRPPQGFPLWPRSQLVQRLQGSDDDGKPVPFPPDPTVLVLTDVPTRIELQPAPDPANQPAGFDFWGGGADDLARPSLWLATMAGLPENLFSGRFLHVDITKGDQVAAVVEKRDRLREFKTELRAALLARGAFSATEATACDVTAAVCFADHRGDQAKPLPEALTKLTRADRERHR